jgi:aryl-alcohol dehydrogenase-like predicted oxidoreductase
VEELLLGETGLRVSALCLGTMHFGSKIDGRTATALLDTYAEAGGSFLDTANNYATWVEGCRGGESEGFIGSWLKERGNRNRMFIASKVGLPAPVDDTTGGLRAAEIERECEHSLRRLGTDRVDLYYAHVDDRSTPLEESLEAFHRLVQSGKVRALGVSNFATWRLEQARWVAASMGATAPCCVQQRYSYLVPNAGADFDPQVAAGEELLDFCASRGVRLLAYSPLLGGVYGRTDRPLRQEYVSPLNEARLAAAKEVAASVGATPNQTVLAWLLQSDPEVIPVFGASNIRQLEEDLGSLNTRLSEDHLDRLRTAGLTRSTHPDARRDRKKTSKV